MRGMMIAGNWKMNCLAAEATQLAKDVAAYAKDNDISTEIVLCPSHIWLQNLITDFKETPLRFGAQDCHHSDFGAFTGSVSAPMLQDIGAKYVIIGHSERRMFNHEGNELIRGKVALALEHKLKVILCVGETQRQREEGETNAVLDEQIEVGLPEGLRPENLVVAYEPVWAIGTGLTASTEQIEEAHNFIRKQLAAKMPAETIKILYGGSVKPSNATEILALDGVDGALVGGASLKTQDFCEIINAAEQQMLRKAA